MTGSRRYAGAGLFRRRQLFSRPTNPRVLGAKQLFWYESISGVSVVSGDVSDWADGSNHGTQNDLSRTAGNRPSFVSSGGPNGLPYIHFDRTVPEELQDKGVDILPSSVKPFVWAVVRFHTALPVSGADVFLRIRSTSTGHDLVLRINSSADLKVSLTSTAGTAVATGPTVSLNTWYLVRAWWDGANVHARLDNGSAGQAALGGSMDWSGSNGEITLGNLDLGSGSPSDVDYLFAIAANAQPTAYEHQVVLNYLNGLTGQAWTL